MATSNKGYVIQSPGDTNWGTVLNDQMIKYVDLNIGGQKEVTVTATTNITGDDARNVIYRLIGALGGNSTVILNEAFAKGFFIVENKTTGPYTVSIKYLSNATTVIVPKDALALLICDSTNGVRLVSQSPVVTSFSAGTTGLTPSTATNGTVTLGGVLGPTYGGTGLTGPGGSGNILTSDGTNWTSGSGFPSQTSNAGTALTTNGTTLNWNSVINLQTLKTATGLNVDFTNIPSWVKKVTVMFDKVKFSGTSNLYPLIQLGTAAGPYNSNYTYTVVSIATGTGQSGINSLNGVGFPIFMVAAIDAGSPYNGSITFDYFGSYTWVVSGVLGNVGRSTTSTIGGTVTLPNILTQIRITNQATPLYSFNGGSLNISYC